MQSGDAGEASDVVDPWRINMKLSFPWPMAVHSCLKMTEGSLNAWFNLKAPITTAEEDIFCDIFPNFRKK